MFSNKPTTQHDFSDGELAIEGACRVFGCMPRDLHILIGAAYAPAIQLLAAKYKMGYTLVPHELLVNRDAWAIAFSPRNFSREQLEDGYGRNMQAQYYWSEGA